MFKTIATIAILALGIRSLLADVELDGAGNGYGSYKLCLAELLAIVVGITCVWNLT